MIAHWPNKIKKRGAISHTLSHLIDLMPTILEASDITPTSTIRGQERFPWDGRSILPSIEGKKQKDPSLLFFSYARGKAIRVGNWKLVFNKDNKKEARWELYDMKRDPNELNNLAGHNPDIVEQLAQLWQQEETEHLRKSKL
jgi:arylsulfatase